jgi:CDP-diacylglycerol--serine O-phosphatidyltransferase
VFPEPLTDYQAALPALALMIVPAVLMVSTIRFRSFKTIDLQARRSYTILLVFALVLVAIATHPRWTLLVIAYTYLASAFVEMAVTRYRRRGAVAAATATAEQPPQPGPAPD